MRDFYDLDIFNLFYFWRIMETKHQDLHPLSYKKAVFRCAQSAGSFIKIKYKNMQFDTISLQSKTPIRCWRSLIS